MSTKDIPNTLPSYIVALTHLPDGTIVDPQGRKIGWKEPQKDSSRDFNNTNLESAVPSIELAVPSIELAVFPIETPHQKTVAPAAANQTKIDYEDIIAVSPTNPLMDKPKNKLVGLLGNSNSSQSALAHPVVKSVSLKTEKEKIEIFCPDLGSSCLFECLEKALSKSQYPITSKEARELVADHMFTTYKYSEYALYTVMLWQSCFSIFKQFRGVNTFQKDTTLQLDRVKNAHLTCRHVRVIANETHPFSENALQKLKNALNSSVYWGDEFAVDALEEIFNIQLIVIDEISKKLAPSRHQNTKRYERCIILFTNQDQYMLAHTSSSYIFNTSELPKSIFNLILQK